MSAVAQQRRQQTEAEAEKPQREKRFRKRNRKTKKPTWTPGKARAISRMLVVLWLIPGLFLAYQQWEISQLKNANTELANRPVIQQDQQTVAGKAAECVQLWLESGVNNEKALTSRCHVDESLLKLQNPGVFTGLVFVNERASHKLQGTNNGGETWVFHVDVIPWETTTSEDGKTSTKEGTPQTYAVKMWDDPRYPDDATLLELPYPITAPHANSRPQQIQIKDVPPSGTDAELDGRVNTLGQFGTGYLLGKNVTNYLDAGLSVPSVSNSDYSDAKMTGYGEQQLSNGDYYAAGSFVVISANGSPLTMEIAAELHRESTGHWNISGSGNPNDLEGNGN